MFLGCRSTAPKGAVAVARPVPGRDVLPLALEDAFQIQKVFSIVIDPVQDGKVQAPWYKMEQDRRYYGAINHFERRQRDGHSFLVHWKVDPSAASDVTVRLEYRQVKLGAHVQTQEAFYPGASGSQRTEFRVWGEDYHQDGKVVAWRILLIRNDRIVGLQQSFLW